MQAKAVWTTLLLSAMLIGQGLMGQGRPVDPGSQGKGKGNQNNPGNAGGGTTTTPANTGSTKPHRSITWLTPRGDAEAALLDEGMAEIEFTSSIDLTNVAVWLTPSLRGITVDPEIFEEILADEIYVITLQMEEPPTHTLGGTLHLRASEGNSRAFAPPYPINIKVQGDDEEEEEAPEAELEAVVSSANYAGGSVTPGQTVSVFGKGLGPKQLRTAKLDEEGKVATYLGDTQVLFNGLPAPVLAASEGLINVVVPKGVGTDDTVEIQVTHGPKLSQTLTLPVQSAAPALFTLDGSGSGQAAALNQNGTLNGTSQPAAKGSAVVLYGTGFGEFSTELEDGAVVGETLPLVKDTVKVTIGGAAAKVLYAGGAPGMVSGVVQLNVEVPAEVPAGDKVTVVVTVGSKSGPATATIAVQ